MVIHSWLCGEGLGRLRLYKGGKTQSGLGGNTISGVETAAKTS